MGQSVALQTLLVMVGTFMAVLDTTVVDIALPKMIAPLKTDLYGIQWVVTSYMISAAVVLPLLEWLEGITGLRLMYIAGVVLFTGSSYLCGISQELYQMILFRSLQGVGEALIIVSAQSILFALYPEEKRGLAMGIFGLGVSFAPALGPSFGGWITEHLGWNWIFFINVPVGIVLTVASIFFLVEPKKERRKVPFNFRSFLFISVATVGTLVVLSKGQQFGWFTSNFIAFLTLISVASYILYLLSEATSKVKLVDLSIFKRPTFLSAFLVYLMVLGFSMYALFYAIPLYFEHLKGLSTFTTGILLLPFAVSIAVSTVVAGLLTDKWSSAGTLILAIVLYLGSTAFLLTHFDFFTPKWEASLTLVFTGAGMGLFFAPVTVIALKGLEEKTVLVVSLLDYIRFVGGSFGTAIATNVIEGRTSFHFEEISSLQGLNYWEVRSRIEELSYQFLGQSGSELEALIKAYYSVAELQGKLALSYAFQDLFVWCSIFALIGLIPLLLLKYNKLGWSFSSSSSSP